MTQRTLPTFQEKRLVGFNAGARNAPTPTPTFTKERVSQHLATLLETVEKDISATGRLSNVSQYAQARVQDAQKDFGADNLEATYNTLDGLNSFLKGAKITDYNDAIQTVQNVLFHVKSDTQPLRVIPKSERSTFSR